MNSECNTILLVEDEADLREVVFKSLNDAGYKVVEASDGREALEILLTTPSPWFALITDFNMPNVNGGELIRRTRELEIKFQAIIIASSACYEPIISRLMTEGPISLLPKPYSSNDLIKILKNAG